MDNTWILVANAAQATVYTGNVKRENKLNVVKSMSHPESRQKNRDLSADKEGNFSAMGHGTMNQDTSPKSIEEAKFAREVSAFIELAHAKHHFEHLVVMCGPHFMGLLRKSLGHHLNGSLDGFIEKDYTKKDEQSIIAKVREDIYPFYAA